MAAVGRPKKSSDGETNEYWDKFEHLVTMFPETYKGYNILVGKALLKVVLGEVRQTWIKRKTGSQSK